MLDLLYMFLKVILTANLSILLILYFPARLVISCCLQVKHENLEKLNDFRSSTYYVIGFSLLFMVSGIFSPISPITPLYMLFSLGVLGLFLEIYNKNISLDKENIRFLMFFSLIFMFCFGQYVVHSWGHDEWYYFELLRSYILHNALPIRSIVGLNVPEYGLLIPALYVLSLNSYPLMTFVLMQFQALLLTILFMSIFGGITKFKKLDLLIVFLLVAFYFIKNFAAAHIAFLMVLLSMILLMSGCTKNFRVQFFILLFIYFSLLIHPSTLLLGPPVLVMVTLARRINLKPFVASILFVVATTLIFFGGWGDKKAMQWAMWLNPPQVPQLLSEKKTSLKKVNVFKVFDLGPFSGLQTLFAIAHRSYTAKSGNLRAVQLSLVYFVLLFFGNRIYS